MTDTSTNEGLPNDYTPCEEYRGYVIGLRHGLYSIFSYKSRTRVFSSYSDRAECRRKIDEAIDGSRLYSGDADERRQMGLTALD